MLPLAHMREVFSLCQPRPVTLFTATASGFSMQHLYKVYRASPIAAHADFATLINLARTSSGVH